MLPEKPVKPAKSSFTDEQIRVKAYQLWEKNKEQSPEENWKAAVKALERERFWRPLISVWRWTGIGEKKGWDIVIQLLSTVSIPVLLFFATQYFTDQNNKQQQKIAEEKQKDELLKTYINDMKASLLDKDHHLKDSKKNSESRSIARTITLTTLTQLNSEQDQQKAKEGKYNQRKGLIMQFLFESGLINVDPEVLAFGRKGFDPQTASIISLNTADFNFANLENANLENANLENANLSRANLIRANLSRAYLGGVNLNSANLDSANLNSANLDSTNLIRANLDSAKLGGANLNSANLDSANLDSANLPIVDLGSANLIRANLSRAYLGGAYLANAQNLTNQQIKSACSWEQAIYTERTSDNNEGQIWIAQDPKANQRKIAEIKQDKASDPSTPPDCSMWND